MIKVYSEKKLIHKFEEEKEFLEWLERLDETNKKNLEIYYNAGEKKKEGRI